MDQRKVQRLIEKYGVPGRDAYELPTSPLRFPDGAHYRMEVSGVERPEVLEAVIDEAKKRKVGKDVPIRCAPAKDWTATSQGKDEELQK